MSTRETSSNASSCTLGDIDWKVHRVLSSDKIANIDESLVRLELHLDQPSSESRRQVSLELSREELERVISELDNAKKALDQLKEK
mmetsp:Transcript_109/g.450  ORF Transcript_109/g.450 Transcript_109/m.450 type:complete len:86 (+) Transcript_109:38-295(+)